MSLWYIKPIPNFNGFDDFSCLFLSFEADIDDEDDLLLLLLLVMWM